MKGENGTGRGKTKQRRKKGGDGGGRREDNKERMKKREKNREKKAPASFSKIAKELENGACQQFHLPRLKSPCPCGQGFKTSE